MDRLVGLDFSGLTLAATSGGHLLARVGPVVPPSAAADSPALELQRVQAAARRCWPARSAFIFANSTQSYGRQLNDKRWLSSLVESLERLGELVSVPPPPLLFGRQTNKRPAADCEQT